MEQVTLPTLHGTAIAYAGAGCLILGASGTGKSTLAAQAILLGAKLVGDDRLVLSEQSGMLMAAASKPLSGVLELRGLGLIRMTDILPRHVIHLAIELVAGRDERLPEPQPRMFAGIPIPFLQAPAVPHTSAASLMLYLKAMQEGRILPPDWHPAA